MASSSDSPVISKSILDSIKTPPPNWKPPRRFLFGLGPPWEPNSWECPDSEEEDIVIAASQEVTSEQATESLECQPAKKIKIDESLSSSKPIPTATTEAKSRWKSPVTSKKLESIRQAGIPKSTAKQTQWALSIWKHWARQRKENLIEDCEHMNMS